MQPITVPLKLEITITDESLSKLRDLIRFLTEPAEPKPVALMNSKERSVHAHFGGQQPPTDRGLLIDTKEACKLLKVSSRTLYGMYSQGRMPQPIRIGSAVRWSYEELKAWVAEGCPSPSS